MSYQPPQYPNQPASGQPYGQQPSMMPGSPATGQPYGAPPPGYGYQPVQEPKKRKKWPWIVGGIVLAVILGCGALSLAGVFAVGKAASDASNNQKGNNAAAGQMNKSSVDGKFQFTVTGMQCGVDSVGPDGFGQKAQGEFCLVSVQVKNVGKSAEVFNDFSQRAYDAKGTEFSPDSGAGIYVNKDSSTFLESINPGNTVKGKLVFDVPKGAKLASVVLHESEFTAGVKVPLK